MLLDLLFPRFCIGCNCFGSFICVTCQKSLEYVTNENLSRINTPTYIDKVICIVKYKTITKKIIKTIKYKLIHALFKELYIILSKEKIKERIKHELNGNIQEFYLQPIPLHSSRYKSRGFNQAELFAKMFSELFSIPLINSLERKTNTKPQALLNKSERKINIQNAFCIKDPECIKNKTIILVDDVFTTGTTSNEAAKVLKLNGSGLVFVLTFALD